MKTLRELWAEREAARKRTVGCSEKNPAWRIYFAADDAFAAALRRGVPVGKAPERELSQADREHLHSEFNRACAQRTSYLRRRYHMIKQAWTDGDSKTARELTAATLREHRFNPPFEDDRYSKNTEAGLPRP